MKVELAIIVIAAAILNLQPPVAAKSSSSIPQSHLDPQAIQDETDKAKAEAKHKKYPKHTKSHFQALKHNKAQSISEKQLSTPLAESGSFDRDPGTLYTYPQGKVKKLRSHKHGKSQEDDWAPSSGSLSWTAGVPTDGTKLSKSNMQHKKKNQSSLNKSAAAENSDNNVFKNSAEATGNVIMAPARALHSIFAPKSSSQ